MSGAGRGTPRVSPVTQAVPSEEINTSTEVTNIPWAWWHAERTLSVGPLLLTTSYQRYAPGTSIPLGATRGSVSGTYTPVAVGGFPVFQLIWGLVDRRAYRIADTANVAYPGTDTEGQAAQVPVFGEAFALPVSLDTDPINFLLPFWVPPASRLSSERILFEVEVREGSGGAVGTVEIETIISENFGEAQGVARL